MMTDVVIIYYLLLRKPACIISTFFTFLNVIPASYKVLAFTVFHEFSLKSGVGNIFIANHPLTIESVHSRSYHKKEL